VDLRSHLRGDAGFAGRFADDAGLPDAVRQRLLAIDVLAELQRGERGEGVRVLGGADDDGVEQIGLVVQLAEIAELFRLPVELGGLVDDWPGSRRRGRRCSRLPLRPCWRRRDRRSR
jgi:hypothetical protein